MDQRADIPVESAVVGWVKIKKLLLKELFLFLQLICFCLRLVPDQG